MTTLATLLAFTLAAQTPPPAPADASPTQLKQLLDATGFKYSLSSTGRTYLVVFDHPENRRQTVWVSTAADQLTEMTFYRIYTQVWFSKTSPPEEALMHKILGRTKKLGSFYLYKDTQGTWALRFSARFDATDVKGAALNANDELVRRLKDLIFFVNAVGEETDKEINGAQDTR